MGQHTCLQAMCSTTVSACLTAKRCSTVTQFINSKAAKADSQVMKAMLQHSFERQLHTKQSLSI
jgi:hypothetical protein